MVLCHSLCSPLHTSNIPDHFSYGFGLSHTVLPVHLKPIGGLNYGFLYYFAHSSIAPNSDSQTKQKKNNQINDIKE